MELNKFDIKSDGLADIYRAALYLARGADKVAWNFLTQAEKKLNERLAKPANRLTNRRQRLVWAEKILDQYLRLKNITR